ncbi:hypothetical protein GCM10009347_25160 [Shewanella algicola]|nr:hypothetical protein GCM10009347_25160 [Shewanella algicola]
MIAADQVQLRLPRVFHPDNTNPPKIDAEINADVGQLNALKYRFRNNVQMKTDPFTLIHWRHNRDRLTHL